MTGAGKAGEAERPTEDAASFVRRQLRIGWALILLFLTLGIVLETLHGFKVAWYVGASSEVRQVMWRLAHAHGTLLGLLHIALAATASMMPSLEAPRRRLASRCLAGASALLPAGFFLGGFGIRGGDPGLGILLVPVGAVLLFAGVLVIACALRGGRD